MSVPAVGAATMFSAFDEMYTPKIVTTPSTGIPGEVRIPLTERVFAAIRQTTEKQMQERAEREAKAREAKGAIQGPGEDETKAIAAASLEEKKEEIVELEKEVAQTEQKIVQEEKKEEKLEAEVEKKMEEGKDTEAMERKIAELEMQISRLKLDAQQKKRRIKQTKSVVKEMSKQMKEALKDRDITPVVNQILMSETGRMDPSRFAGPMSLTTRTKQELRQVAQALGVIVSRSSSKQDHINAIAFRIHSQKMSEVEAKPMPLSELPKEMGKRQRAQTIAEMMERMKVSSGDKP
jgi:Mg2+ and Co2+ transporter CorA